MAAKNITKKQEAMKKRKYLASVSRPKRRPKKKCASTSNGKKRKLMLKMLADRGVDTSAVDHRSIRAVFKLAEKHGIDPRLYNAKNTPEIQCSHNASSGMQVCDIHGALSPHLIMAAKERLAHLVLPCITRLGEIALKSKQHGPAVAAIKEILAANGMKEPVKVEIKTPEQELTAKNLDLLSEQELLDFAKLLRKMKAAPIEAAGAMRNVTPALQIASTVGMEAAQAVDAIVGEFEPEQELEQEPA